MKKTSLIVLFILQMFSLYAWNSLMVSDPRNSWYSYPGTIREASMSIHPKGAYLEYGLYLTFSSEGSPWNQSSDTLEIVMNFDLPEEAIVIDSWLWIGDDIVKAQILDKWSASSIYEGIVKRRRDPSILTKTSSTHYELRIFPLVGSEERKIKITYLMPATWNKNSVEAELPMPIVHTSFILPDQFYIFTWTGQEWKNPSLVSEGESQSFQDDFHPDFGQFKKAAIPADKFIKTTKIRFDSPMKNGVYLSRFEDDTEGIYQLVINPNYFLETGSIRKIAVLIDYDASNTDVTQQELLNIIKTEMLNQLNPVDSFNLIFSNLNILRYSDRWVSATESNLLQAFESLNNPLSAYSNLPSLLGNGIDFVKTHGNDGKILLISDSDNYGEYSVANTLIKDITGLMDVKIQMHITDFQTISVPYYYFNNQYFRGNEYLYTNLSRLTGSSYFRLLDGFSISQTIADGFEHLNGAINSFDLHTDLEDGFCFSRYNVYGNDNLTYLNDVIVQVGKFYGSFPFNIEISGNYDNEFFSNETQIEESETYECDTIAKQIWVGQWIREMEKNSPTNDLVNNIIYQSITERVLSGYTAFLCLEDSTYFCPNCEDETELVAVEDSEENGAEALTLFPNPFSKLLNIKLYCEDPAKVTELALYTPSGMLMHRFDTGGLQKGENLIRWNAENLSSGMYFLIFRSSGKTYSFKLVKS